MLKLSHKFKCSKNGRIIIVGFAKHRKYSKIYRWDSSGKNVVKRESTNLGRKLEVYLCLNFKRYKEILGNYLVNGWNIEILT